MPKISKPCILNDYRPVALTSIAVKCFKRIIRDTLVEETKLFIDPFQFAYCAKRGVEDAVVTMIHKISEHLDKPRSYVRTLFIHFSSAFNTMQPHTLIRKLQNMNTNPYVSYGSVIFCLTGCRELKLCNSFQMVWNPTQALHRAVFCHH